MLAYGLYSLWGTFGAAAKPHLPPRIAAALGGLGGGMTGTVVGTMGSVFFAMYFDAIRLAKDSYRATMTAILLTLTVIRGIGYFAVGEFSRDVWIVTAILFPSMLVGLFIGNYFHHGMSELAFRRIVACALDRQRHGLAHQIAGPAAAARPSDIRRKARFFNGHTATRWHALCIAALQSCRVPAAGRPAHSRPVLLESFECRI